MTCYERIAVENLSKDTSKKIWKEQKEMMIYVRVYIYGRSYFYLNTVNMRKYTYTINRDFFLICLKDLKFKK